MCTCKINIYVIEEQVTLLSCLGLRRKFWYFLPVFQSMEKYYLCAIFTLPKIGLTFVLYTGENNEWLIVEAQIHGNWKDMVAISSVHG